MRTSLGENIAVWSLSFFIITSSMWPIHPSPVLENNWIESEGVVRISETGYKKAEKQVSIVNPCHRYQIVSDIPFASRFLVFFQFLRVVWTINTPKSARLQLLVDSFYECNQRLHFLTAYKQPIHKCQKSIVSPYHRCRTDSDILVLFVLRLHEALDCVCDTKMCVYIMGLLLCLFTFVRLLFHFICRWYEQTIKNEPGKIWLRRSGRFCLLFSTWLAWTTSALRRFLR